MPLSRHCVGTYPEMSPHATCQGTFCHSHLSLLSHCGHTGIRNGISVWELIPTSKKEKAGAGGEWMVEHSPQILVSEEKATTVQNSNSSAAEWSFKQ